MKKLFILLFLLGINNSVFSQIPTYIDSLVAWAHCYGGSTYEGLEYYSESGFSRFVDDTAFVSFPVYSLSSDGGVPGNYGGSDIWYVKANKNTGNIVWSNHYGGSWDDEAARIIKTSDGGSLIIGNSESHDGDVPINFGMRDVLLMKLDAAGNVEWSKNYGGSAVDIGVDGAEDSTGYLIAALTYSKDSMVSFGYSLAYSDIWVFKTDLQGNLVWEKTIGGTGTDFPVDVCLTPNNKVIVCGTTQSNDFYFSMNPHQYTDESFAFEIDFDGNVGWVNTYGGSRSDQACAILAAPGGGYFISNITTSLSGDGDITYNHNQDSLEFTFDVWLTKIDTLGNIIWDKSFGGQRTELTHDMVLTSANQLAILCLTRSTDGDVGAFLPTTDSTKIWFMMCDMNGNLAWEASVMENTNKYNAISLMEHGVEDGGEGKNCFYLLCMSYYGCSAPPQGAKPAVIDICNYPVNNNSTGEEAINNNWAMYPNPTTNEITIESLQKFQRGDVVNIYNSLGTLVKTLTVPDATYKLLINLNNQPAGVYYLRSGISYARFVVM